METIQKVIKDGKVAVVHSADYGNGLYSNFPDHHELLFSPALVDMIESRGSDAVTPEFIKNEFGIDVTGKAWGGYVFNLEVTYLPVGTKFHIVNEDGKETIITEKDMTLQA